MKKLIYLFIISLFFGCKVLYTEPPNITNYIDTTLVSNCDGILTENLFYVNDTAYFYMYPQLISGLIINSIYDIPYIENYRIPFKDEIPIIQSLKLTITERVLALILPDSIVTFNADSTGVIRACGHKTKYTALYIRSVSNGNQYTDINIIINSNYDSCVNVYLP